MNIQIRALSAVLTVSCALAGLGLQNSVIAQTSPEQATYEPSQNIWNRTELYFGTEKPDGSEVSAQEFRRFIDRHVTPRFPDGLTLLSGSGQWREADGDIVKERSFVLVLLYPRGAGGEIETIRALYKRAFKQESVLRVDSLERVGLVLVR